MHQDLATLLNCRFPELIAGDSVRASWRRREFKVFSQHGEDGLLAHILSRIGPINRTFVEIGVGDGRECLTANLSIKFGWRGLLIEGQSRLAARAKTFYSTLGDEGEPPVRVVDGFVTVANVNKMVADAGITGEIDLLSVDIDGNDYWIWQAISIVAPRVVAIEYNASFGDRPISVAYDPAFSRYRKHASGWYHGASLVAMAKLGARLGYELVCADSAGVNAFFVKRSANVGRLPSQLPADVFYPHRKRTAVATQDQQFELVSRLPYVGV